MRKCGKGVKTVRIIIDFPDDCSEQEAVQHISGCFNQTQLDYRRIQEGRENGTAILFGDGRDSYFYKTKGSWVLKIFRRGK